MTDDLRRKAEAATPGPWRTDNNEPDEYWFGGGSIEIKQTNRNGWIAVLRAQDEADAAYIAAASPDAILALLDERDALRAALTALVETAENYVLMSGPERDDLLFDATQQARAALAAGEAGE